MFCIIQFGIEWFYPERVSMFFQYLGRYWGRGLLYTLTGLIQGECAHDRFASGADLIVSVTFGDNNATGARLMCFVIGIIM